MRINKAYILFLSTFIIIAQNLFCQVTFVIDSLPKNTLENAAIYISGDFEGWTGGQENYKFKKTNDKFYFTFKKQSGSLNFKFTQGSWSSVEMDKNHQTLNNRNYTFQKENDTIKVKIMNWIDNSIDASTVSTNVKIISTNFNIPQLKTKRRIWIYLPPDHNNSGEKYPVMYMHDGQNLFGSTKSRDEWQIDETLDRLYKEKNFKVIIVGIDNGVGSRLDEYSPWRNEAYQSGGKGDLYLDFIINTLKPHIDKNYNTLTDKDNTAIMGSSMGGYISHYAGLKFPNHFGKIGVFSPSFWFSNSSFVFANEHSKISASKMYFLVGKSEGRIMIKDMKKMAALMRANGFNKENILEKYVPNGIHSESFWEKEFEAAILWLFNN